MPLEQKLVDELWVIRRSIESGDDSKLVAWAIPGELACAQRPLRDHPKFGGREHGHDPLPPEARPLVEKWVDRIVTEVGVKSIICLLEHQQLDRYYVRGGLDIHSDGLLGYYEDRGLQTRHIPLKDYQQPSEEKMQVVLHAFAELPKPVLLHCSAAIDRTAPVAAFLVQSSGER